MIVVHPDRVQIPASFDVLRLAYGVPLMPYRILIYRALQIGHAVLQRGSAVENVMNKEQVQGKAEQLKGAIKKTWAKLTDDDILLIDGQRDQFLGKLKEHYGLAKEDAETKMKAIEASMDMPHDTL